MGGVNGEESMRRVCARVGAWLHRGGDQHGWWPRLAFRAGERRRTNALKCAIAYNRYGGYCVPLASRHRPAAKIVCRGGVFEPETLAFMRAHCDAGDIVHAGTYYGDFLPALSTALAPGACLWGFEPVPEHFRCAQMTVLLNALENVRLVQTGLGATPGRAWIETVSAKGIAHGGASRIVADSPGERTAGGAHFEPVDLVCLDQAIPPERRVSILQLDVEGYELPALQGGIGLIRRCRPIIILELWDKSRVVQSPWFAENIVGLGYRRECEPHGNAVFVASP